MTATERAIRQQRVQAGGWLVPRINELLKKSIHIETQADVDFITYLSEKMLAREAQRKKGGGVYSPSGLASCLRQVYLRAHWQELGYSRLELPAIEPHYYFLTGDFIHLKWQFVLYRLGIVDPDFELIDVEVPVISKRGDHGGTIDVVALLEGELVPIDVKGLNIRGFQKVDMNDLQHAYRIQIADYMMLWNVMVQHGKLKPLIHMREIYGWDEYPMMNRGIILAENKGGPDINHPAALTESIVKLKDVLPDVQTRLGILRAHEEEETLPEIECVSTKGSQFQGCPFAETCYKEVRRRERAETTKSGDPSKYRVARPKRSDSPRRSRPK